MNDTAPIQNGIRPFQDRSRRPLHGPCLSGPQVKAIEERIAAAVLPLERRLDELTRALADMGKNWDGPVPAFAPVPTSPPLNSAETTPERPAPAPEPVPSEPELAGAAPDVDEDEVVETPKPQKPRAIPPEATPAMALMLEERGDQWDALLEIVMRDAPPQVRLAAMRKHLNENPL